MKKNYRGIILLVSSFVLLTGFVPLFFGSGLTESKPFNLLSDTNFDPLPTGSQPYDVAFTNLDFNTPLNFNVVPNSNNIVVGQRDGKVFWFDNDENVAQKNLLVDLSSEVGGKVWDGGFLGLSIHPLFGSGVNKNFVYVYYTTQSNDKTLEKPLSFSCGLERFHGNYLILEKFEVDATSMQFVENSRMTLIKRRMFNTTHRGGGMEFGNDGYLYVSTGDQAAYINAQQISENLDGGVLRIDVDMDLSRSHIPLRKLGVEAGESDEFSGLYYTIPNDNPFVDASGSVFEEYYSIGHRNPHRLTKDFQTGIFYIGEVGEDSHEEINVLSSGKNYGWPLYEGFDGPNINCLPSLYNNMPHTRPLVSFPRTDANAIIGGYVYRGSDIPELTGKYICADYGVGSEIWSVDVNNGAYELLGNFAPTNIVSFGQDKDGELYLLKQGENVKLYKMKSKSLIESAPQTLTETGIFVGEVANLDVREGFIPYDLIDSFYSDGAIKSRWMAIPNDGSHNTANEKINFSENDNWDFPVGTVLIKHFDYPIDDRNLSITRKVETRFSIKDAEGKFYFLTYKWNEAQTEAYLVDTSIEEDITITTISGATRQISWHFPSEGECLSCHNPSSGGTLGPRTKNLNKNYDYVELGGSIGNQLVTLSALGILDQTITDVDTPDYITHTSISNVNSSLEDRARSYLDLNCAYCHNPSTDNRANFDLRLDRTLVQTGLLTAGVNESLNMDPNERILYEGDALKSILYHRTASVQPGIMMPPLAKNQVDDAGVALLESWINSLQPSVLPPDSGIYRIVNVATNNTLQVLNGGNSNSVNIVHQEYQEEDWQHFQFDNATVGYYEFKAVHSEKYLDVAGFGPMTGSNVWQYEGNNSDAQLWEIIDAGDDSFFIINSRTSKYLTAMADGNVIVAANDGSGRVKWKFETTGVQTNTNAYHYRLNAAGPSVASTDGGPDWAAGATSNGLFTGGGYTVTAGNVGGTNPVLDYGLRDGSIPSWMDAGTYASIFTNERWDPISAPEMGYRFTVPNGAYRVNIFVANNCSCTENIGERVYSISMEGSVVESDLDLAARYGHRVGGMLSYDINVADGELDITFLHGTENTLVNAIEVKSKGEVEPVEPDPLTVNEIDDLSSIEGNNAMVRIGASGGDPETEYIYTATGLPVGISLDSATGLISGIPVVDSAIGGPNNDGLYPVAITVERGTETVTTGFVWTILPEPPVSAYHYRLNAAGPSVASTDGGPDWAAGATSNGLFTGGGYTVTAGNVGGTNPVLDYGLRDGSIPSWMDAATYASIFTNERWDPGSAPEMGYRFTVPNGAYRVNIFVANNCSCTENPGERVYSISVEGSVVESDLDLAARYGHRVGGMLSYDINVADGELDITFLHGTENTLVNAIEVKSKGEVEPVEPDPLTVNEIDDLSSIEGNNAMVQIGASGGDPETEYIYTAIGLPIGISLDSATGLISGIPVGDSAIGGPNNDGLYPVAITVERGTETVTTGFVWTILPEPPVSAYHYRLNAAGPSVASTDGGPDWAAGATSNGMFTGGGYTVTAGNVGGTNHVLDYGLRDGSIPSWMDAATYASIFTNERWDPGSAPEMGYRFTVPNGTYTVNLFVANNCSCTENPGERVYSISMEGSVVEADLDLAARYGHRVGGMLSYDINVADGQLDITFLHGTENTLVNAIEVKSKGEVEPVEPDPLTVNEIDDLSSIEGNNAMVRIGASGGDPETEYIYTATGLPIGISLDSATGLISGIPVGDSAIGGPNNDGLYPVAITVERGTETVTTGFVWTILPQPPVSAYHYRLNAAGPSVASTDGGPDWAAGATSNGLFTGGGYTVTAGNVGGTNPVLDYGLRDGSIPSWMDAATYASIFTNERWDPGSAPEMGYRFTVPNGTYTVNLFVANNCSCTENPGERVYSISMEGSVVEADLDLAARYGHRVGGMLSYDINVADGELDITFLHGTENTLINAIEVKSITSVSAKTRFLINDPSTKFEFTISQNPVLQNKPIQLMITSPNKVNGEVTIFSLNGKVVKTFTTSLEKGANELLIVDLLLQKGFYLVQVENNGDVVLRKLLVN